MEVNQADGDDDDGILRPPRRDCCRWLPCNIGCCSAGGDGSGSGSGCARFCTFSNILVVVVCLLLVALSTGLVLVKIDDNKRFQRIDAQMSDLRRELAELQTEERSHIASLTDSLQELRKREESFEHDTEKFESGASKDISSIRSTLDQHEQELVRLNNGTSNADVLDELQHTKSMVRAALAQEQQQVQKEMAATARNISVALEHNQKQVQHTQKEIHEELSATEQRLTESMDASMQSIHVVQQNVTAQLGDMSSHVRSELVTLTDIVDAAKAKIHAEVATVQDDIAQYVAVTNKKFAAENDFVKYQLAGECRRRIRCRDE